jgi:hypothetical protein
VHACVPQRFLYDDLGDIRMAVGGGDGGAMEETACELDNRTLVEICTGDGAQGSCNGAGAVCAASLCGEAGDACPTAVVKYVTCLLPPGSGRKNPVTLYRSERSSYSVNGTDVITLRYLPPAISAIGPALVPTTGGIVTLTGTDFAATKAGTSVVFGGVPLAVEAYNYSHTSMRVVVPAGAGVAQVLELTVDGQSTTLTPGENGIAPFAYAPPHQHELGHGGYA